MSATIFSIETLISLQLRRLRPVRADLVESLATMEPVEQYPLAERWFYTCGAGELWEHDKATIAGWGTKWQPVFHLPRQRDDSAIGFSAIRPEEFVAGLLFLHRFGIDLSVHAAVDAVRSAMLKRRLLTSAELHVFWAPREIGRMSEMEIRAPFVENNALPTLPFRAKTSTGYRLEACRIADEIVLVSSPLRSIRRRVV